MLVDFENYVNDVFDGLFMVEMGLVQLYYEHFLALPFGYISRFNGDISYLATLRNRIIFQTARTYTNNCENVFQNITLYTEELTDQLRKIEKQLAKLKIYVAQRRTRAMLQSCDLLIEKLFAYEFEETYLVEHID